MKERLLFIDVMRIVAIVLVLVHHLATTGFLYQTLARYYWLWNPFPTIYVDYGFIGVFLFVFASGCSLAVSDSEIQNVGDAMSFYKKRILRMYPIFWISLLFTVIVVPSWVHLQTPLDYLRNILGFQAFFQTDLNLFWGVNGTYWFIGAIISLYLFFPLVLIAMRNHPHKSLLAIFVLSMMSRYVMFYVFPQFIGGIYWFPLCRLFEFSLGIYIVRMGVYPKIKSNVSMAFFGKLTFYVYLVHSPLLYVTNYPVVEIVLYVGSVLVFASMFYVFDGVIHNKLSKLRG